MAVFNNSRLQHVHLRDPDVAPDEAVVKRQKQEELKLAVRHQTRTDVTLTQVLSEKKEFVLGGGVTDLGVCGGLGSLDEFTKSTARSAAVEELQPLLTPDELYLITNIPKHNVNMSLYNQEATHIRDKIIHNKLQQQNLSQKADDNLHEDHPMNNLKQIAQEIFHAPNKQQETPNKQQETPNKQQETPNKQETTNIRYTPHTETKIRKLVKNEAHNKKSQWDVKDTDLPLSNIDCDTATVDLRPGEQIKQANKCKVPSWLQRARDSANSNTQLKTTQLETSDKVAINASDDQPKTMIPHHDKILPTMIEYCSTVPAKKTYTCKKQKLYTIKNGRIVDIETGSAVSPVDSRPSCKQSPPSCKQSTCSEVSRFIGPTTSAREGASRLSVDEIRKLPRFTDYEPGKPTKKLFCKNLPKNVTKAELLELFGDGCVTCKIMQGKMRGQAFMTFTDVASSSAALEKVNGTVMRGGKPVIITYGRIEPVHNHTQPIRCTSHTTVKPPCAPAAKDYRKITNAANKNELHAQLSKREAAEKSPQPWNLCTILPRPK